MRGPDYGEHVADPHRAACCVDCCVRAGGHRPRAARADIRSRRSMQVAGSDASSQFVPLGVGKSVVIDLPRDIKDVLVADPKIANAVIRSSRRAYIIGVAVGQTNVYFFDAEGRQIAGFDIAVTRDLNGLRAALKQALPQSRHPRRGPRRRRRAARQCLEPDRSAAGLRHRHAPGRRRQEGRQRHHRPRPRSGHAQGDRRGSAARRHQAARHRSHQRRRRSEHRLGRAQFQQHQPVPGLRPAAGRSRIASPAPGSRSARRCAPWSAPASSARWPSRT